MIQQVGVQVKFNAVCVCLCVFGEGGVEEGCEYAESFPWMWQNVPYFIFSIEIGLF